MLAALAALRGRGPGFDLRCVHVEHGIRAEAESRGDADFVRALCGELHVPCRVFSVPPGRIAGEAKERGTGIEAAARRYRMRALFRAARQAEAETLRPVRILTAHTRDDMLETSLMGILRGAGPSGLAAMPAAKGRILRPLLPLSRADILRYLAEKNICWREDSTNADARFFRNRVRRRLAPLLSELFPQWKKTLASFAEIQSLSAGFIAAEAAGRVQWRPLPGRERTALCAEAAAFFAQPGIVREEALFQGIDRLMAARRSSAPLSGKKPAGIRRINVRRFAGGEGFPRPCAADLGPLRAKQENGKIVLSLKKKAVSEYGFSLLINSPGLYYLKSIALEVCLDPLCGCGGDGAFYASLPLVFRPFFRDDRIGRRHASDLNFAGGLITAADSLGPAAFIGPSGLLLRREEPAALPAALPAGGGGGRCMVRVSANKNNGGVDVR